MAHAFTHGADAAFLTGAAFALVGLVAALLLIRIDQARRPRVRSPPDSGVQPVPSSNRSTAPASHAS